MTDIFNNESQEQTNTETNNNAATSQADIFVEKLMGITRDDGSPKYESVEQALDALKASQEHIRRIEADNATLKTRAEQADQLKETLARLQENKNVNEEKPNAQPSGNGGLSEEAVKELVRKQREEERQQEAAIANIKTVQDAIIQKLGSKEKAQEFVKNKATALGITAERLKYISAESPNAALALLGESVATPTPTNTSTVRLPNTPPTEELKAPEVSLLSGRGATNRNQMEYLKRVKEKVYREQGITS